jgi:hypothetical protein
MRHTGTLTFMTAALALLACSRKPDAVPTPDAAPPPSAAASAAPEPATPATAAQGIMATLSERLVAEAQNRPHITPNADDVLAAFAKTGAGIATKKQGLGATFKASFCEGGTTGEGWVTVSICEYSSEDAAKTGFAAVQAVYPAKQARHVLHKNTVLTTLRLQDGLAAEKLESKMIETYAAL